MTENPKTCSHCGGTLTGDAAGGLCPRCLMAMNFDSRTMHPGEEPAGMPPLPPEEIADRFPGFEILECLGRGGMGVVYKARQKSLDRIVAIKILPPEGVGEEAFSERFAREAATLAKLSHPNIVTVHDFGETAGLFYIVMEYVDGVNLRDLLREGKLEAEQALAIVPPICEALQYAHDKGIVHRDIKPENLLLDRDGRVKIADFGIASLVGASGESAGTPPYMAPEQSGGRTDHRADIYALGVVLYEMLTGERPEKDVVAPSRKMQVDVRIDEMVLRALEKEPELRYQTAGEFRTAVETMAPQEAPSRPSSSAPANQTSGPAGGTPDGGNEESSRQRIQWPAGAMAVVGGINVLGSVLGMLFSLLFLLCVQLDSGERLPPDVGSSVGEAMSGRGTFVVELMQLMTGRMLSLGAWVFAFVAALRMRRLQSHGWAMAGAIVFVVAGLIGLGSASATLLFNAKDAAILNRFVSLGGITPGFKAAWSLLELGIGIWALVSLLHRDTKRAFENRKPDGSSGHEAGFNARAQVAWPATGLMVASCLNLLLVAITLFLVVSRWGEFTRGPSPQQPPVMWMVLYPFVAAIVVLFLSSLTFIGAWRMRRLRGYGMAIVGSALGILAPPTVFIAAWPIFRNLTGAISILASQLLFIGVVFGLWALVVLSRSEVREAFAAKSGKKGIGGVIVAGGVMAGILLLAVLSGNAARSARIDSKSEPPFQPVSAETAQPIPGTIVLRTLSADDGEEVFLDFESGRISSRNTWGPTPGREDFGEAGIDLAVKIEAHEPKIAFWNCSIDSVGGAGPGGLIDGPAMRPDTVESGWGKSLRQIVMELPVPAVNASSRIEGKLPMGIILRTRNGLVALEITRYSQRIPKGRQLDLRYVMLPPG